MPTSTNVPETQWVQADYELDNDEDVALINSEAAKLAKQAKEQYLQQHPGEVKFVAGAIGPTNKTLSVSPSVENPAFRGTTYNEIEQAYYKQVWLVRRRISGIKCMLKPWQRALYPGRPALLAPDMRAVISWGHHSPMHSRMHCVHM